MKTKKKQVHKSKEQLIWEKEQKKQKEERTAYIEGTFMPLMDGLSDNLEEAQMLCESCKTAINQAWQMRAGEMKLEELNMTKGLDEKIAWKHIKILETLKDQSIKDAMILLDALFDEVQRAVTFAMKNKKIKDFSNDNTSTTSTTTEPNSIGK